VPDFLVLKELYETNKEALEEIFKKEISLIGVRTKIQGMGQISIENVVPREPEIFPYSQWETIEYSYVQPADSTKKKNSSEQEELYSINFWELDFAATNILNDPFLYNHKLQPQSFFNTEETNEIIAKIDRVINEHPKAEMFQ
jgi:hypothetical protein